MVRSFESSLSVIVIDDGIEWEGSCRWPIGQWMPQRIDGEQPFVFARNCNRGIKAAGGNDVILLNDDALLKVPGGFRAMQRQWIENPEYGLIASTVDKCGTPCQHRQRETGLREATDPMVAFICVFIPRSTIDKVGLLDERFGVNAGSDCPAYGVEDDDYCWRVRAAGLKLGVSDSCFVTHTELPSTFGFRDAKPGERKAADILPHKKLFREKHGVDPHAWCR
jgi:GT2 family glycosyltransferase